MYVLKMNEHYAVHTPIYVFLNNADDRDELAKQLFMFSSCENISVPNDIERVLSEPDVFAVIYNAYGTGEDVGYLNFEDTLEELQWLEVYTYYVNMDRVPVSTEVIIDSDFYFSYNMPDPEQGDDAVIVFYHFALDSNGTPLASSPLPLKLSDMPSRVTLLSIPLAYKAVYGA